MTDTLTDLATARAVVEDMADLLAPLCQKLEIAGSIRRGKPAVKDAELVVIPLPGLLNYTDEMVQRGLIDKALYGDAQSTRWGNKYRGMLYRGMKVELFLADEDNWGYQYWLRTGPGDANTFIMSWLKWRKAPIQARDGDWFWTRSDETVRLAVRSEQEMFELLGMPFIEPQNRSEGIYRHILNRREDRWPDYSPFVAVEMTTLLMAGIGRTHYQEDGATAGGEKEAIWRAEQEYNRGLMARHNAIFERAARGEPLQRWEERIVKNRQEIDAFRAARLAELAAAVEQPEMEKA